MKTASTPAPSLRDRKRLAAMTRVQDRGVALFREHGFDAVTVEEVAAAADVSPVSVYRWFGSKEGIVLWDDYDPALLAGLADRLARQAPLEALRDTLIAELDRVYATDRDRILVRTQLVHREPALLAAADRNVRATAAAFAAVFADAGAGTDDLDRTALASAAAGVLTAAIDAWQRDDARTPLADLIRRGFDSLRRARWTT